MIDRLLRRQRSFFLLLAVMLVIGFLAFEFASSAEVALAILLILEEVPLIMLWVFITAPRLHLQVQARSVASPAASEARASGRSARCAEHALAL